jgi:hypothetical protein
LNPLLGFPTVEAQARTRPLRPVGPLGFPPVGRITNDLPWMNRCVLRFDHTSRICSDYHGRNLATDGGPVRRIEDASGYGNHAKLIYGGVPPTPTGTYKKILYGKPAVQFSSSGIGSRFMMGRPPALDAVLSGQNFTVVMFAKPNMAASEIVFTRSAGGAARVGFGFISGQTVGATSGASNQICWGDTQVCVAPLATGTDSQPHVFAYTNTRNDFCSAAGFACQRTYVAGAARETVNTFNSAVLPSNVEYCLGGFAGSTSNPWSGQLLALYVFDFAMKPHEVVYFSDLLYTIWNVTNPSLSVRNAVWNGNSLSVFAGSPSIPEKVRIANGLNLGTIHSLCVGGKRTDEITAEGPYLTDPLLAYLKLRAGIDPAYLMWECSNDQSAAAVQAEFDARVAAGTVLLSRTVTGTVLPRNSGPFNTQRAIDNTAIAAMTPAHVTYIADVASDATIGPDAAASNGAIYPDGIHLADADATIAAGYFETQLASAMA